MRTGEVKREGDFKGAWLAVAQAHSSTLGGHQRENRKIIRFRAIYGISSATEEHPQSSTIEA